ncbi:MAG TPA: glycosyltransferase family 87 protein [Gemmatales bacterium]|nr:glycosyltransferase family 87 protein [Gemmatales bacterium]
MEAVMNAWLLGLLLSCFLLPMESPAQVPVAQEAGIPFGGTDFKQYYTTSRLLLEGHNPYDYEWAGVIQRALGEKGDVQVPYGPPTSLLPFIPMGWVDFLTAIQIQFVLNVSMLVLCCFLWGAMLFPKQPIMPLISTVAVVAWIPCLSLFGMGHVTAWTLLGFTLWCFLMQKQKPGLAGCSLALSIIKPHLAFGLVIYACVVGLRQRQWKMLLGFFGTVGLMIAATFLIRPSVWSEYLGSLAQSNPTQWFNATLDGWGRYTFGSWFRIISGGIGLAFLGWIVVLGWTRRRETPPEEASIRGALVLALWMVATPYAFSYDFVLLLPAFILAIGAWLYRAHQSWMIAIAGWIVLNVIFVLMKTAQWYEYKFAFIPWFGLALLLLLMIPRQQDPKLLPAS